MAGAPCALARSCASEILPLPNLHSPPAGGGALAGFLNLGGAPVPVVDLALLLSLRDAAAAAGIDDPYRHIVLAADGAIGFLVDRVADLVLIEADAIRAVSGGATLNGCVAAEITRGDRLIHVLSMERLLTQEERGRIAAHARAARGRLAAFGGPPA